MKNKTRHILVVSLLIWGVSFSQQFTNYTTKDGLPSNHVYTILQDVNGFMWFLTDKGIAKYNGAVFKTFTTKEGLPNNDVWDGFTTPDGKFWYLSKSISLGYIIKDSVISFSNANKNEIMNPIYSSQIGNNVYLGGPNKIYKLDNKQWKSVSVLKNGRKGEGLIPVFNNPKVAYLNFYYDALNRFTLSFLDANKKTLKQVSAEGISNQKSVRGQVTDSLYYWVSESEYSILDLNTLELKRYFFKDEVGFETVKYARLNKVGDQIQISGNKFVGYLDKNFHIVDPFYIPEELNAHFGLIDSKKTIWLSTFNKGVFKLPHIKRHIVYQFENDKILNLNYIENDLYLSVFNKGFYKYKPKNKTFNLIKPADDYVFGVCHIKERNTTYFLSQNSIFIEENGISNQIYFDKESVNPKLLSGHLNDLEYFNSELYASYYFGVYKLDQDTLEIKEDYSQKGCNDLLGFNSRLLLATNDGLKELRNDSIQKIHFKNTVFNRAILSIKPLSDTKLLINTDGYGSYITDLDTIKPIKASEFLIVQDAYVQEESIWLATNTGVLHLGKFNDTYELVKSYSINDGLPNNNVNSIVIKGKDLIVGTNSGLAIIPINQDHEELFIDIIIEDVTFNDERITDSLNTFRYTANNRLNLKVTPINFSEDNKTFFSYRLDPVQKDCIVTSSTTFNFNNLKPDDYVFSIESGTIKKQLSFTVTPLWWQTLWAKISLLALVLFGLVYSVWSLSKRIQKKKNNALILEKKNIEIQLRALRSQMNPHFVFNSLAAIQYYINTNDIAASETYLVKFSKLIRQFFEWSKETQINLKEELKLIENYLDIEKLRFKDKFIYHITVDKKLNLRKAMLPTMLLQPIVENAINHGIFNKIDNGKVFINVFYESEKRFKVEIIDDGVGFANTQKQSGRKVKSSNVLEDRLRYLNKTGIWDISYTEDELHPDLKDKGSKSTFVITQL
ncbi:histidine kinase [Bizionia paragorgiae]|uniref:sensor histidine kinase n=1 Tax=Bizionia paragorgiae TaxID=283786 RepID=UPI00299DD9C3|nr:histidine kinase [Bizionia paragorgiae]MDX1271072.1 histidine kinase [Bizionia paragorgiae]